MNLQTFIPLPVKGSNFLKAFLFLVMAVSFASCSKDDPYEEARKRMEKQLKIDDEKIQAYIEENDLQNVQKTASGVYYIIQQEGTGPEADPGDMVSVHYKLFLLNGNELESSYDGDPFEFLLGWGQVIPGWDEGIAQLREGSQATLLIPSPLAYGEQARGPQMPANSILRFDVELVNVTDR